MSKYGVFSDPYFTVFGPGETPYLDTFHTVKDKLYAPSAAEKMSFVYNITKWMASLTYH